MKMVTNEFHGYYGCFREIHIERGRKREWKTTIPKESGLRVGIWWMDDLVFTRLKGICRWFVEILVLGSG